MSCSSPWNVTVDSANGARQEMLGFGHAWTDSTVISFNTLESDVLDQVMQDLYGQEGNNMGFMRHTIGSSDLSHDQFSYDDNGPSFNLGEPDLDLVNFNIGEAGTAMVDIIARMGSYKSDVFLFGSPWSYPGWTKFNGLFIAPELNVNGGGSYNLLNNSFDIRYIPQMIQYFSKYVDAFKAHGVQVNGITPMNEPLNYQGGYPCMYLESGDEAALIAQGLGAAMHERGVRVMAYDHNTDQPVYPYRVVQRGGGYVDAAAWHCYASPVANYSVMDDFHYQYPEMLQFMTECSNYKPQAGAPNFEVATSFIPPVQNWASGASMWVMGTDTGYGPHSAYGGCDGCSGSIIVNSSTTYTKTNDYYMIGQFSRFIRRGAVNYNILEGNYGSALTESQFWSISVKNPDGSWVVVFMNNYADQEVILQFTGGESTWKGSVPNSTVTTWLLPAPGNDMSPMNVSSMMSATSCPTSSSSSPSTASSSSLTSTTEPVPNTTHMIASVEPAEPTATETATG